MSSLPRGEFIASFEVKIIFLGILNIKSPFKNDFFALRPYSPFKLLLNGYISYASVTQQLCSFNNLINSLKLFVSRLGAHF